MDHGVLGSLAGRSPLIVIMTKRRRVNSPPLVFHCPTTVERLLVLPDYFTGDSTYGDDTWRNPFVPAGIVTVVVVVLPPDGILVCKGLQTAGFRLGDSSTV
jgi:hypothetical protein